MSVAEKPKAKDVLVSLLEASESVAPSVKTVSIRRNVSHVDSSPVDGF